MWHTIADALREAWQGFAQGISTSLPRVLAMLTLVLAGWVAAWLAAYLSRHLLRWIRFNALVDRTGGGELLRRAGLSNADQVAASILYWLVFIGFLLSGVQTLGVTGTETMVSDFMRFVPRMLVAVVIVFAGFALASFAWRATLLAAVNASLPWARPLGELVRFLILLLAIAMALEQVAVAREVVLTAFAITFGAVMLGVAIALGIGGSGVVRRVLEHRLESGREKEADPASHL